MLRIALSLASFASCAALAAVAQAPSDRALLPDAAVVAIEIPDPRAAVDGLLAALGPVPAGLPAAQQGRIAVGLGALALGLGGSPSAWAERVAGGGAVLGLVPVGQELVPIAVTRPAEPAAAERWLHRVAPGLPATLADGRLLVAADRVVLEQLRARLGQGPGRWAGCPDGLAVVRGEPSAVRIVVDVDGLRRHFGAAWPAPERLTGAARLVLGPLAHAVTAAHWLRLGVAGGRELAIGFVSDADPRAGVFGGLVSRAPVPRSALPPDALGSVRLDRSWRALLAAPEQFLDPAGVQAVRGFLAIVDALDGARTSFVDDVLGGLGEPIDLLVWPPAADPADTAPLVLPQFALVAPVVGGAAEDALVRMARSLATIVNAERAQRRQPPFLVRVRRSDDGAHGLVAEPPSWRGPGLPPVDRQLSPTLWFAGDRVALGSTEVAAQAAVALAAAGGADAANAASGAVAGDRIELRGAAVRATLLRNRAVVELGRMFDEGEGPAEAAGFADALTALAGAIAALTIEVAAGADGAHGTLVLVRAAVEEQVR